MSTASVLRESLGRWMPRTIQRRLKRWYYPIVLRNYRYEDWPESCVVRRLVQAGDFVVDAGANVGYISILLARMVGPGGIVHSFEPVPPTFDLLQNNVRRLRLLNVRPKCIGLSDRSARVPMTIPDYGDGRENLYMSKIVAEPTDSSFDVDVARLDELLGSDGSRVAFVKVDVEGHELAAIRGARGLLMSGRAAFLVEVSGDPDSETGSAAILFSEFANSGYSAFLREGRHLRERAKGDQSVDYYFLTRRMVVARANDLLI